MQVLNETALVETFNLKAAIEYQLKNCELIATIATPCPNQPSPSPDEAAKEALTDMPPRSEEVWIGITL